MINTGGDFLWLSLFVCGLIVVIGLHFVFNPPKDLDTPTGLNFPSSIGKLNMDTWTELHVYSGKMLALFGSIGLLLNLLLNYLIAQSELSSSKIEGLNLSLLLITSYAILITTFVCSDNHMNKTFDKKGNRRQKD